MAHLSSSQCLLSLAKGFKRLNLADPLMQCLAPRLTRQFASQTQIPVTDIATEIEASVNSSKQATSASQPAPSETISSTATPTFNTFEPPVLATLYSWPSLEPQRYAWYNPKFLDMPLRRDILHRAVVFEADATRQGTASTKWRGDVHGSNRKLYQQKGTGKARVRDKKSPIRRGGGVAFGPKPRDFSTELQRKVYDQAWRIALSYRHRRGELIILNNNISLDEHRGSRFLNNVFEGNQWGKENGRSLLVTRSLEQQERRLFEEMRGIGEHGALKDIEDVDVKDLLETGRIVIEKAALNYLLLEHSHDVDSGSTSISRLVKYM